MTETTEAPTALGAKELLEILPHRYPFMFVDRVIELDKENKRIVALKNVSMNEGFFQGHFPGAPIMPGVLILEALAQAGGILFHDREKPDKITVLLKVDNAKFRSPVRPGDALLLECEGIHVSAKGGRVKAKASVGGKIVCEADIAFGMVSRDQV